MKLMELQKEAAPFKSSFEEVLKLRGKARTPAIEKWLVDNQDHRLAVLYDLSEEKSSSRKKLGAQYLRTLQPTEREAEAYAEMISGFIGSSKPTLHAVGLDLLRGKVGMIALMGEQLGKYVAYSRDEANALTALSLLGAWFDSEQAPDPEDAVKILDRAIDHWSDQVSEQARELTLTQGIQPRASKWEGCPLSGEVRRQLGRLGASIKGTPDPSADRSITGWENFQNVDTSNVQQIPWPIAYFDRHVQLPSTLGSFDPEDGSLGNGSGLCYAVEENGRQYFLKDFLYHDVYQYFVTLNLTDTSDDPQVYEFDHEGWMRGSRGSLSRFLSQLRSW